MTQQDIAEKCCFTKGLLSKIENGSVIPPIATLSKLSKALGVKMSTLLDDTEEGINAHFSSAHEDITKYSMTSQGYAICSLVPDKIEKKMTPLIVKAKNGEVKKHLLVHEGEEFIYIISGSMEFKVANIEYQLKTGESIYFSAFEPHGIIHVSNEVTYIDIFVE